MAAEVMAILRANTSEFTAKMGEAKAEMEDLSKGGASNFSKLSAIGKGALLGIGAAALGVGVAAIDFGNKLEDSQAGLQAALKASGISWDKVKGSVDKTAASGAKYGDTEADVEAALAQGVIATGSYSKAHKGLQVALELSAAKHISLSSAMQTVDKVYAGSNRALTQLGINLDVGSGKLSAIRTATQSVQSAQQGLKTTTAEVASGQLTGAEATGALAAAHLKLSDAQITLKKDQDAVSSSLDALSKRLSGQANAAANTFSGRLEAAKANGENLAANLGVRLIPILERVVTVVMDVVTWFEKHKGVAEALGIALAVLVAGPIAVYIGGMVAAAAATVAAAAPWLAIIAIAVAVGLAVYEIVNHWHDIVAFFKDLWKDVKKIFDDAWSAIKGIIEDAWHVILTIFEDATLAGILYAHWRGILSGVETAWNEIVSFFSAIPGRILGALSSLGSGLMSFISGVWGTFESWVESAWNAQVTFVGQIPGKIITALAAFGSLLLSWFETAWNTFYGFVQSAWSNEVAFWTGLPSKLLSALASLVGDLLSLGGSVMGSFAHGVSAAWGVIASWFTGLPTAIVSAIGDVVDLLYNIGKTIINSLKRGLVDAFNDVKNFVSNIAGDIASLKGPIGYDATLLIPHGMAIMQSLRQGLQAGYASSVAPYMSGIAGQIAGTSFGTGGISPIAGGGGGAASVSGGAGGGGMQPINLILNGDVLGTALIPILQMKGAQYQRTVPQPMFGVANASVS